MSYWGNSLEERIDTIKKKIQEFPDWENRYKFIMDLGRQLSPMEEKNKEEKFLIKGCQSLVWLYPELKEGRIYFQADSESALVKGIISLLVLVYNGELAKTIFHHRPDFLKEIGIAEQLTMNRSNGLLMMIKQIHLYAAAFLAIDSHKNSLKD